MVAKITPLSRLFNNTFPGLAPFELRDLEDFPYTRYVEEQELYQVYEDWYNSVPLNQTITDAQSGKVVEKYPIKINPLRGTAQKHASTVIGQNVDSIRFGGLPFQLIPDLPKEEKGRKDKIRKALLKIFEQSSFGAQFLSNCIRSQYLGGSVIAAKWLPDEKRIEISTPSPKDFIGIPTGADYWNLRKGWIVKEISEFDAKSYGYEPKGNESKFWYIEYWTKTDYKIMINGHVLKFPGNDIAMEGKHTWGKVPIIYTPHLRLNGFLGEPILTETVKGVIKELNLRWADIGDAVSDDAHGYVAVRNVRGTVTTINVGDGRPVLDLGSTTGMANEPQPDMFSINMKSASEPMLALGGELFKIYRRETNHPAVADGEDEGSQRSSLTLATRMAPLVAEADMERVFHTVGITHFANILLTIMADKKLEEISKEDVETSLIMQWQSMLPKDRESLTQEAAVRSKNHLGSNQHLMGLFGDINDEDEEMEKIAEEIKKFTPVMQPGFGGNGANVAAKKPGKEANSGGEPK